MIDLAMSQSHLRHKFIFQYIMVFMSKAFHAHFLCTNIWVHLTKNMLCETEKKTMSGTRVLSRFSTNMKKVT